MRKPAHRVLGKYAEIEQPKRYTFDTARGWQTIRTWVGPEEKITALTGVLSAAGWNLDCIGGFANWTLVASIGQAIDGTTAETPIDSWELLPNAVEKSLLRADIAYVNSISSDQKARLESSINNNDKTYPTTGDGAITDSHAQALWPYMRHGEVSVTIFAPVLRHIQTVSNRYTVRASNTNVGRIISTATLSASEGVPADFLISLPDDAAPGGTDAGLKDLRYGWLKARPTISKAAYNKAQISQEWAYGLWNTLVYGAVL